LEWRKVIQIWQEEIHQLHPDCSLSEKRQAGNGGDIYIQRDLKVLRFTLPERETSDRKWVSASVINRY